MALQTCNLRLSLRLCLFVAHSFPAVFCKRQVPESVRVHSNETPMVGVWDAGSRSWNVDNVSEVSFNPEDRILKFQAVGVGLLSLVQPR